MFKRLLVLISILAVVSLAAVGCNQGSGDDEETGSQAEEQMTQTSGDSEASSQATTTEAPATSDGEGLKGIGREGSAIGASSSVDASAETPLKPIGPTGSERLGGACGSCNA